ncbi:MAG: DUF1016 family protein [Planctomycetes bacterium]|nr:DUF1016 family protein [Planctomycetota bacterium]
MRYDQLVASIVSCHRVTLARAATAANQSLVLRNWLVGGHLVEYEQLGEDRARYGEDLLSRIADDLALQGLDGLGVSSLRASRRLYQVYPGLRATIEGEEGRPLIRQSVIAEFPKALLVNDLKPSSVLGTPRVPTAEARPGSPSARTPDPEGASSPRPLPAARLLQLTWTHLLLLLRIDDPWKRAFYENECLRGGWSVRQLRRQIESLLYERTGLSTDKRAVIERGREQADASPRSIEELIRDPYVLEFTGLAERPRWFESDLEQALLSNLQSFLLELGTGFCFEARQYRVQTGAGEAERVDLVFYQRKLRCHVLVDLKLRAFQHGDAGQMNFYLNWFRENVREEGDELPVGLLLCSDRDQVKVEYALGGLDNQLFVSRYQVALPSVEQLRAFLERDREWLVREHAELEYGAQWN